MMRFLKNVGLVAAGQPDVIIIPGNGAKDFDTHGLYTSMKNVLTKNGIQVAGQNMPEPEIAPEKVWLPFIENKLAGGRKNLQNIVLIGHSSGALAAMRLAEKRKIKGMILVAAAHTDLGDENEKASGYFGNPSGSRPWDYKKMLQNCGFIVQFASKDDPVVPIAEQRHVFDQFDKFVRETGTVYEYFEMKNHGHFKGECQPLNDVCLQKLLKKKGPVVPGKEIISLL